MKKILVSGVAALCIGSASGASSEMTDVPSSGFYLSGGGEIWNADHQCKLSGGDGALDLLQRRDIGGGHKLEGKALLEVGYQLRFDSNWYGLLGIQGGVLLGKCTRHDTRVLDDRVPGQVAVADVDTKQDRFTYGGVFELGRQVCDKLSAGLSVAIESGKSDCVSDMFESKLKSARYVLKVGPAFGYRISPKTSLQTRLGIGWAPSKTTYTKVDPVDPDGLYYKNKRTGWFLSLMLKRSF